MIYNNAKNEVRLYCHIVHTESGRAGRDGKLALALIMKNAQDLRFTK